jgi:hypothetical protein
MARDPGYRTPVSTLERIVPHPVYLQVHPRGRPALVEKLNLSRIGLAVTASVTSRFGADRERAARTCADEAASLLGERAWRRLPPGERIAWERWGPLVAVLPGVTSWPEPDRRALAAVIRAKGGRCESEFVRLFDAHGRLRAAIVALSRANGPLPPRR